MLEDRILLWLLLKAKHGFVHIILSQYSPINSNIMKIYWFIGGGIIRECNDRPDQINTQNSHMQECIKSDTWDPWPSVFGPLSP